MSDNKYLPFRTCIGCGKKCDKSSLIKTVKNKKGEVFVDADKNTFGRGAYVCKNIQCVLKAEKKKRLARALKLDDCGKIYEKLKCIAGDENGQDI